MLTTAVRTHRLHVQFHVKLWQYPPDTSDTILNYTTLQL